MEFEERGLIGLIRQRRLDKGLTQAQLAARAQLSVPAIQKIESGRGNPELRTLLSLFAALGIEAKVAPRTPDWASLSRFGVPLLEDQVGSRAAAPTADEAAELLREASAAPHLSEREQEALQATLIAIQSHYPRFFLRELSNHPGVRKLIELPLTGRVIKLRRLALARVSEFL